MRCPVNALMIPLINDTLFKAVVPLAFVTNIESRSYYQINNNIAIASDVLISGDEENTLTHRLRM